MKTLHYLLANPKTSEIVGAMDLIPRQLNVGHLIVAGIQTRIDERVIRHRATQPRKETLANLRKEQFLSEVKEAEHADFLTRVPKPPKATP